MTVYLIVRAVVPEAHRKSFDDWYQREHLPDAHREFKVLSAQRGWSSVDSGVHLAIYEFPDMAAADAVLKTQIIKDFVAEFDRHWAGKVERTRELVEIKQKI